MIISMKTLWNFMSQATLSCRQLSFAASECISGHVVTSEITDMMPKARKGTLLNF